MNGTSVLLYHEIAEQNYRGQDSYAVSRERFEQQVTYLLENKFCIINLKELIELHKKGAEFLKKTVILTFDDGFDSDYRVAFPILKKYGLKAEIFITTNNIGKEHYLNQEQIIELYKNGFSIQSHMVEHLFYSDIKTQKQREYQIGKSKEVLENIIKGSVDFISLPGGRYDQSAESIAKQFNYLGICTSMPGGNWPFNPYFIQRTAIKNNFAPETFIKIVNNDQGLYAKLKYKYELLYLIKSILGNKAYYFIWRILFRRRR